MNIDNTLGNKEGCYKLDRFNAVFIVKCGDWFGPPGKLPVFPETLPHWIRPIFMNKLSSNVFYNLNNNKSDKTTFT